MKWCICRGEEDDVVPCNNRNHDSDRPFSRDGRPASKCVDMFACPVCLIDTEDERALTLETCNHKICYECAQTMVEYRYRYDWCSRCPVCRQPWGSRDYAVVRELSDRHTLRVPVHIRMQLIVFKIGALNRQLGATCALFAGMYGVMDEENMQQVGAVGDFLENRIDYAQMRRLAG